MFSRVAPCGVQELRSWIILDEHATPMTKG